MPVMPTGRAKFANGYFADVQYLPQVVVFKRFNRHGCGALGEWIVALKES